MCMWVSSNFPTVWSLSDLSIPFSALCFLYTKHEICLCVCVCVCAWAWAWACARVCAHVCLCVRACACACMFACLYVCVFSLKQACRQGRQRFQMTPCQRQWSMIDP